MKRVTIGVLSGVALATGGIVLCLSNPASAAVIWDWNYSGSNVIGGSGTFTTTDIRPDGSYLITDIMGTSEGETITSLIGFNGNDNLLFGMFPQLSQQGVSYSTLPSSSFNLFFSSFQERYVLIGFNPLSFSEFVSFSAELIEPPATTPEPSSLIGFITLGGLMLGSALRKARHP